MKPFVAFFILISVLNSFSQEQPDFNALDSLYREDQFYVGITYNSLLKMPSGINQNKFTPSFSMGFLRDFPVNKKRTFAIAMGLGYSLNNYNQNILISENNGSPTYSTINSTYEKNKLSLHYFDLPIEIRWRNSSPESHKFWRIYSGFKVGYLFYSKSKFVDNSNDVKITGNPGLNILQYGTYLSVGYNTLNFYVYYGLNPIFKSAVLDNKNIEMKTLNFGFMFYIL